MANHINQPATRQGRDGKQFLYRIHYRDSSGDGPVWTKLRWRYNEEHAREAFLESCSEDPYWAIVKIETVKQSELGQ